MTTHIQVLTQSDVGLGMKVESGQVSVKVSSEAGNLLTLGETGLFAGQPRTTTYVGDFVNNARATGNHTGYRTLTTQGNGGVGILHLDFSTSYSGQSNIFTLPANSPTPVSLIEVQVRHGSSAGSIWIDARSKNVYGLGLPTNTRIIVDLIGFWR